MTQDYQKTEKGTLYQTRVINWQQPKRSYGTQFMLTFLDSGGNEALSTAGYRGRYVIFTNIEVGNHQTSYDPRKIPGITDELREFFLEVRRRWQEAQIDGSKIKILEDGATYGPDNDWVNDDGNED